MRDLKLNRLIKQYIKDIVIIEKTEKGINEFKSLIDLLKWQDSNNNNILKLKNYLEKKFNVEFNDSCDCTGNIKLSELCNEYEFRHNKNI